MIEAILAILLSLPPPWYADGPPETRAQYETRLGTIAEAIALETRRPPVWTQREMAAAVMVTWYFESRFAVEVHAGGIHPVWTQDDGRARCLGSLHVSGIIPPHEWVRLAGTDLEATRRCAAATVRMLAAHARRCSPGSPSRLAAVLGAYGRGSGCQPTKRSYRRVERFRAVLAKL